MTSEKPLYQRLFGRQSSILPEVFLKHYGNRIGCDDQITADGVMETWRSPLMVPVVFLLRWSKTLIPINAKDVETKVVFRTTAETRFFWYDRTFHLPDGQDMTFLSRMEIVNDREVIEWTGLGIGWHCAYAFENDRVSLRHIGYQIKLGKRRISVPLAWILGRPSAWEKAIDGDRFEMEMNVTHSVFGKLYSYAGRFRITEVSLDA